MKDLDKYLKSGVCAGRHAYPSDYDIYPTAIDDVTDILAMEQTARQSICKIYDEFENEFDTGLLEGVVLYPSGLTQAVISSIKAITWYFEGCGFPLVLGYWDRDSEDYFYQVYKDEL